MAVESGYVGRDLVPGRREIGTPKSEHTITSTKAGYGIAQWTNAARKQALWDFAGPLHVSNFGVELAFVAHELSQPYPDPLINTKTLDRLRATNVLPPGDAIKVATAIVMAAYESPYNRLDVPVYTPVVKLLGEWHQDSPTGRGLDATGGYNDRLFVARKIAKAYG